jgi:hypothetical protein
MADEQQVDIAGAELASEVLDDGRLVLLVFLVRGENGAALELGAWSVTTAGKLTRPPRPLVFSVGEVDRVRTLAERAVETLPRASYGEDGIAVLGHDAGLTATAMRAPDGSLWASLGWKDDTGIATVPAAGIASFVRVLAEAERELTELGLVAFPSAQQN